MRLSPLFARSSRSSMASGCVARRRIVVLHWPEDMASRLACWAKSAGGAKRTTARDASPIATLSAVLGHTRTLLDTIVFLRARALQYVL